MWSPLVVCDIQSGVNGNLGVNAVQPAVMELVKEAECVKTSQQKVGMTALVIALKQKTAMKGHVLVSLLAS